MASSSLAFRASAESFEAHMEHRLVADSSCTGAGQPSPKQLDLEFGTADTEDVDLTPEETENAGAGVGGPN